MCTVSVITVRREMEQAIRLVCNRDELRSRPPATAPGLYEFGECRAVMPIDPLGAGTWIAVNDAGVAMVLLNQTVAPTLVSGATLPSRGQIIPSLLNCDEFVQAADRAAKINPEMYRPFRLVLLSSERYAEFVSDGQSLRARQRIFDPQTPLMWTSSGLGDHLVEQPRRELFEQIFGRGAGTPARQDAFQAHRWPDRPHVSVNMSRADARTVSRTIVELGSDRARMMYQSIEFDTSPLDTSANLEFRAMQPC